MPNGKRKNIKIIKSEGLDTTMDVDAEIWAGFLLFAQTKFGWELEQKVFTTWPAVTATSNVFTFLR